MINLNKTRDKLTLKGDKMENIREKRESERYSISEYLKEKYNNIYIEIIIEDAIRANVIDMNMNGVGFEIDSLDKPEMEKIEEKDSFFIKLYIGDEVLFVEVKKMWSAFLGKEQEMVLKGGLMFSVMSPKDRLNLFKFLEGTRKRM